MQRSTAYGFSQIGLLLSITKKGGVPGKHRNWKYHFSRLLTVAVFLGVKKMKINSNLFSFKCVDFFWKEINVTMVTTKENLNSTIGSDIHKSEAFRIIFREGWSHICFRHFLIFSANLHSDTLNWWEPRFPMLRKWRFSVSLKNFSPLGFFWYRKSLCNSCFTPQDISLFHTYVCKYIYIYIFGPAQTLWQWIVKGQKGCLTKMDRLSTRCYRV